MEILLIDRSSMIYNDFPAHRHGYWELIYNLTGHGVAVIGDEEFTFEPGTLFCVPPDMPHRKSAQAGFSDGCLFVRDFQPVDGRRVATFEDDGNRSFGTLLDMAFAIQLRRGPNAQATINALGDAMYQILVGWGNSHGRRNPAVEAFQADLIRNMSDPSFDLPEAVRRTGYCNSYFRKLFKGQTGQSPLDYLIRLRIEHAKRQLQQHHGLRTIKEIALDSGFSDPYYFSRVFRQAEGLSPSAYVENLGLYSRDRLFRDRLNIRPDTRLEDSLQNRND